MLVTLAICTWNRYQYLIGCLNSILAFDSDELEVLVLDSNSTDATPDVVQNYQHRFKNFNYFRLGETGLSKARNKCIELSSGSWICFVDDDTILPSNLMTEIKKTIAHYDFSCFGGANIIPHNQNAPSWLPKIYVERRLDYNQPTELLDKEVAGLFMVIEKNVFKHIGPFVLNLGYNGGVKINGEDTEFQVRMRKYGYKIGYNPNIVIQHYVHDVTLKSLLKSVFRTGRDSRYFNPTSWLFELYIFFRVVISRVIKAPYYFLKTILKRDYHYKTCLFDYLTPLVRAYGRLIGKWNLKR